MRGFPLVHTFGAALVDHALGIAQDDVVRRKADRLEQFEARNSGSARAVANELRGLDVASGEVKRIDQPGRGNDGGAVLIVMKHGNVEQLAQALLDYKALGRANVLQVDPAPAFAQEPYAIDDLVGVLGGHFEVDGIDVGETLEQHRLAFHDRLRCQRAAVAKAKDGGPICDYGNEIAFGGVVEGAILIFRNGEHRYRHSWGIGEREVALGGHRLCGHHFKLTWTALTVKQQRFLICEGRTRAVGLGSHVTPL